MAKFSTAVFKDPSPAVIRAQATAKGLGIYDGRFPAVAPPYTRLDGKCERVNGMKIYSALQWNAGSLRFGSLSGEPAMDIPVSATGEKELVGKLRREVASAVTTSVEYVSFRLGARKLEDGDTVGPSDAKPTLTVTVYPAYYATEWKCELNFGTATALIAPKATEELVAAMLLHRVDFDTIKVDVQSDARLCVYVEEGEPEFFRLLFWTPIIVRMEAASP